MDTWEPLGGMWDDLNFVAQRLSAEAMAERSGDQPTGDEARLSAEYCCVAGSGGVVVKNLRDLYDQGICDTCLIPIGRRTSVPLHVHFRDGQSRWWDGLLAQLDERPRGPTYHLYTDRFLDWLLPEERASLSWHEVVVLNPTKITRPIFELVPSRVHAQVATLRGGHADVAVCQGCGRASDARYPLAGMLPDWLNPKGSTGHAGQPGQYLVRQSLPDPPPAACTYGTPVFGASLMLSAAIPQKRRKQKGARAIGTYPVGIVDERLTMRKAEQRP